jgi:hypothetical protein
LNYVNDFQKADDAMEFYISGSVHGESGFLSIIGRCGSESVRPGAEFRALLREKPRSYPEGLELPREIEECKNVHIKVQEVEAYGKKVDVLPANTTGVLRCVDYSMDLVPGGWILTDQCVTESR